MFFRSVRATEGERSRALPGDELILEPLASLTHAITIRCAPRDVWPWLAQMGAGTRAGWYSYDSLDNACVPSSTHVLPGKQEVRVGTTMPALPGASNAFTVIAFERSRFLVLGWAERAKPLVTWAFALEETTDGGTRLIVRARGGPGYHFHGLPWSISSRILPILHFVMQRKQLLGIAWRAERAHTEAADDERQPAH
jgi:hypothetical protein